MFLTAVPHPISLSTSPGIAVFGAQTTFDAEPGASDAVRCEHALRRAVTRGDIRGMPVAAVKLLTLVLAPDVGVRTRGRLMGALDKMGGELEVLELHFEGTSDEVRIPPLHAPWRLIVKIAVLSLGCAASAVPAGGDSVTR